jgi:hypothetical protein
MREMLLEREQSMKQLISDTLEKEENICISKRSELLKAIDSVDDFCGFIEGYENHSDLALLRSANENLTAFS